MTVTRFTLAYWCVLMAALLPIVCAAFGPKSGMFKVPRRDGGYDNHDPRALAGASKRLGALCANAAQS